MPSCVIDIETASLPDEDVAPALVHSLQNAAEDDEDWRERLGLYALGASVVTIGMFSPESGGGVMLYDDRHGKLENIERPAGAEAVSLMGGDEATILAEFWKLISNYRPVITYNGRGFDIPFLMQRSLIRNVRISTNLMPPRFSGFHIHLDLAEMLSQFRATRPYGLEAWTQALGLASPKQGEVKGAEVGAAFRAGRTREIVEYCLRDVVATAELAHRVQEGWSPAFGRSY